MEPSAITQHAAETGISDRPAILIVDDEPVVRGAFQLYFETVGYRVAVADRGDRALEIFRARRGDLDVVLLDLVMPGMHGIEVLRRLKEIDSSVEVIIATGCGSMNSAIEALRQGAYDYVTKPVVNLEEDLLGVVRGAVTARQEKLSCSSLRAGPCAAGIGASSEIAFYEGLESLAVSFVSPGRAEEVLAAVGRFLEDHLNAQAAMVLERNDRGGITCLACWGAAARCAVAPGASLEPGAWSPLLDGHSGWKRLGPGCLPPALEANAPLQGGIEALHVPVIFPAGPAAARATGHEEILLVFREPDAKLAPGHPQVAILGLVVGSILQRSIPVPA